MLEILDTDLSLIRVVNIIELNVLRQPEMILLEQLHIWQPEICLDTTHNDPAHTPISSTAGKNTGAFKE